METNSERFTEQGYLVVQSVLADSDLAPLIAVVSEVVDARATDRQCPTSWQAWRAQWEASPHKGRFV